MLLGAEKCDIYDVFHLILIKEILMYLPRETAWRMTASRGGKFEIHCPKHGADQCLFRARHSPPFESPDKDHKMRCIASLSVLMTLEGVVCS